MVSWCVGHLIELAIPESYDESLHKWNNETLPIVPEEWQYEVKTETKAQYNVLKKLMNDNRISIVICATEEGRKRTLWLEGGGSLFFRRTEFIALHFYQS